MLDSTLYVFVFKPESSFYNLSFELRLTELERNINYAYDFFEKNRDKNSKGLFLGPEYLFKDFSMQLQEQYYTNEQKNIYKERLIELSCRIDLIIAPGTFCWRKEKEKDFYYRNMVYFFYQGEVQKYHKKHPYSGSDDDYTPGSRPPRSISLEERFKFFKTEDKAQYPEIIKIAGLSFGVEICADHLHHLLIHRLEKNIYPKVDVQLVIADGISTRDIRPANCNKLVYIKTERTPSFPTVIGTVTAIKFGPHTGGVPVLQQIKKLDEANNSALEFYECPLFANEKNENSSEAVITAPGL